MSLERLTPNKEELERNAEKVNAYRSLQGLMPEDCRTLLYDRHLAVVIHDTAQLSTLVQEFAQLSGEDRARELVLRSIDILLRKFEALPQEDADRHRAIVFLQKRRARWLKNQNHPIRVTDNLLPKWFFSCNPASTVFREYLLRRS